MRRVIAIILVLLPFSLAAEVAPLIKCLALEEAHLHKSYISGPIYKLNQKFVSTLSEASNLGIEPKFLKDSCENIKAKSPSVALLKQMILKRGKVFRYTSNQNLILTKNTIDGLYSGLPEIFMNFLSGIQAMMDRPRCLEEQIPEITYFFERFKYLQTDLTGPQLFDDHKKIARIFSGLEKMPTLLKKCSNKLKVPTKN
ncbi:MAG: hypothetical protein KAG61_02075 [Bacteriovoracaceae bacterium]|nr:hypothetical protein [Bacteriovoracaceae bacterium]